MSTEPENKITALDHVPLSRPARPSRVTRRWIIPTRSDSLDRLKASLRAYRHEYEQFKDWYVEKLPTMDDGLSWSQQIDELLITVEEALEGGDEKVGWRVFQTAQRMELYGLAELGQLEPEQIQAPDVLHSRAMSIYNEAKSKLTGWRKAIVIFVFEGFFDGGSTNAESINTFAHAAAFGAGFSERLLISTVDKFGQ